MKKVTLTFPSNDSLWLFKEQSRAINVTVTPMKKTITGLFSLEDVSIAVTEFKAVQMTGIIMAANLRPKQTRHINTIPFSIKLLQRISAMFA